MEYLVNIAVILCTSLSHKVSVWLSLTIETYQGKKLTKKLILSKLNSGNEKTGYTYFNEDLLLEKVSDLIFTSVFQLFKYWNDKNRWANN